MVVKMNSSTGGGLVLAGSEAGSGSDGSGSAVHAANADSNLSDDDNMGDLASSDSDSMDFDDDDNETDLLSSATLSDDITAQLAAAGPVGMAAAAAIASSKKRKRPHSFETNPSIRRRQQTRLLRKLRQTIDEYATRVGQQAVVLIATPGKTQNNFRVFGAKPLEDVVKNLKSAILQDLESALAHQAPPPAQEDPSLYELPPLVIDGIPTPVEKMTQAQLRAFIPLMLKFSTGRGKPGWGKESTRPPWWPCEVPWANVRMDARSEDDKQRVSWTHALRQIVINCYKYHGREDLLPAFSDDEASRPSKSVKTEGEMEQAEQQEAQQQQQQQQQQLQQQQQQQQQTIVHATSLAQAQQATAQFQPTVVQTISNPDGTVSIIQVDPNNPIITLPDGTTAQVQGVATFVPASQMTGVSSDCVTASLTGTTDGNGVTTVDLSAVTESTIGQEGHILLTGEDGQTYPVSVSGMITVPAMYQAVVANISQLQGQSEASVQVVGLTSMSKLEGGLDDPTGTGINVGQTVIAVGPNGTQHILQVTAAQMMSHMGNAQEVDTSILASAMQQVTSTDGEMAESSPTSSSE